MTDGQLIFGMQAADSIESSSNDVSVCSWIVPENTTARVEVICELQRTTNITKSTYRLAANVTRADGDASILGSSIKFDEEGSTGGYEVILAVTGTSIFANTASNEGATYRVVCFMNVYSVEQFVDGYSLLFDGTNEFVTMGDVLDFEYTDSFSISLWFKTTDTSDYLVSKQQIGSNLYRGYGVGMSTSGVMFISMRSNNATGDKMTVLSVETGFNDNMWHHLVFTWTGNVSPSASGISMYVDNILLTNNIIDDNLSNTLINTSEFNLAARNNTDGFLACSLDDVSVYSKELSLSETQAIYNSGVPTNIKNLSSASNLLGYWRCGDDDTYPIILDHISDAQFPTIPDETSNSYDGTATNMEVSDIQFVSPGSQALVFDGTNEYVTMGNVLNFEYTDSFSLSCWYRTTSATAWHTLISKMDNSWEGYELIMNHSGGGKIIRLDLLSDGVTNFLTVDTTSAVPDGSWHHIVATYDGLSVASGVTIYVDGVSVPLTIQNDTLSASIVRTADFEIGARATAASRQFLAGSISDVAMWNKELSVNEVTEIYNNKVPIILTTVSCAADLQGWWRCGERFSLATDGVPDFSGNGLHGTQVNMEITDVESRTHIGSSMVFGGTNEYIDMGDVLDFDGTTPFSWSFWFKSAGGTNIAILGKTFDGTNYKGYFIFLDGSQRLQTWLVNAYTTTNYVNTYTTTGGWCNNTWHHGVVTYDGSQTGAGFEYYIDGSLMAKTVSNDNLSASASNTGTFGIGYRSGDSGLLWIGSIDDVSVYDKELSLPEVEAIYNSGIPTDLTGSSNLVGYWKMGDGVGFNGTMTNMEAGDITKDTPPD